jgi:hypothetical protein
VAALAELRVGDVVALFLVAGETRRAFGEGALVVGALVALGALLMLGLRVQSRQARWLMTAGARRRGAHALVAVNIVAAGAARGDRAVVLLDLLAVAALAGLRGRHGALMRLVTREAVAVDLRRGVLLLRVTLAAARVLRERLAGVGLVAIQALRVLLARMHVGVAARARARVEPRIVGMALMAAEAGGVTWVLSDQRKLLLVALGADLRWLRVREIMGFVTVGTHRVLCVGGMVVSGEGMTTGACAGDRRGLALWVWCVAADAGLIMHRWVRGAHLRVAAAAGLIADPIHLVRIVTIRALAMRRNRGLGQHVLVSMARPAGHGLLRLERVWLMTARAGLVALLEERVGLVVTARAAIDRVLGGVVSFVAQQAIQIARRRVARGSEASGSFLARACSWMRSSDGARRMMVLGAHVARAAVERIDRGICMRVMALAARFLRVELDRGQLALRRFVAADAVPLAVLRVGTEVVATGAVRDRGAARDVVVDCVVDARLLCVALAAHLHAARCEAMVDVMALAARDALLAHVHDVAGSVAK